ncbi:MAG: ATP-binding cassette domain-containing protein [Methanobacterium sp.]|nr:ATP-binding cassette domain-containing protein [Methanobacterium sp.]
MDIIEFKNFSFSYTDHENTLSNININISPGEFVLLCGPSGSGKTTLLSNIKNEIRPSGNSDGIIYYFGQDIKRLDKTRSACEIGFLFQDPDQFISDNVLQEIAFPLENIGLSSSEIRKRIAEMVAFFGLDKQLHKHINQLSGGEKQLVNLCSILVLKPKILLLDEPTSQLDPIAAYELLSILRRLNEDFSITIIVTEHRINNIFPFIDKAIFLENGKIKFLEPPHKICIKAWKDDIFKNYIPSVAKIHFLLKSKYDILKEYNIPITIREGKQELNYLEKLNKTHNKSFKEQYTPNNKSSNISLYEKDFNNINIKLKNDLIHCKNVWFGYEKDNIVLKGVSLKIGSGEFISLVGGNGAGKTTLLQILSGILKPKKGKINYIKNIKIGYVHQNPMIHFTQETVEDELLEPLLKVFNIESKTKNYRNQNQSKIDEFIKLFELSKLLKKHPYDCSRGEQQKIAITKVLLTKPNILFLDEPTKGLDPVSKVNLAYKLKILKKNGLTIVLTTHDLDFVAEYSERCLLLFDGTIQLDDIPKAIFANNSFYTTSINRLLKDFLPESITIKDVEKKWNI